MGKSFQAMISVESLFNAWNEFRRGKGKRIDVQEFGRNVERNIFRLHRELIAKTYKHSPYSSFFIQDPKERHIRKACVRDRLVHQAVYTVLTQIFEPRFINDLHSSRLGKGTHAGVNTLQKMIRKVSRNFTRSCWALKCDVRKFYDSVDHGVLINLLAKVLDDEDAMWLIREIVGSFHHEGTPGKGLPIGNLTSQIFTNIYLNELDQFLKQRHRIKYYARFADDFVILSESKVALKNILPAIEEFLNINLKIQLHPKKISLRPLHQGIDFLGYVTLPHHRVLRTTTKRRMKRKMRRRLSECIAGEIDESSMNQTLQSYLGMMSHGNCFELANDIKNVFCWR